MFYVDFYQTDQVPCSLIRFIIFRIPFKILYDHYIIILKVI